MFRFSQAIAVSLKSTTALVDLDLSWHKLGDEGAEAWDPGEDRPDPAEGASSDRSNDKFSQVVGSLMI